MNAVLLGGNGYIGRAVTEYWLAKGPDMKFYVLSRSGKNELKDDRIVNIAVDTTDKDAVMAVLPETIDYVADFVGGRNKDKDYAEKMNMEPAKTMMAIAEQYNTKSMGYIGGVLGPKDFTSMKKKVLDLLKTSPARLDYVEPTLVYGNGRSDSMSKMVPMLKFFGIFSKNLKPVEVKDVAKELVDKMTK